MKTKNEDLEKNYKIMKTTYENKQEHWLNVMQEEFGKKMIYKYKGKKWNTH